MLSSRELVDEIIPFLPETSAYKTARRGGDWSTEQYIQAAIGRETALARADGYGYMPDVDMFNSPLQKHLEAALDDYRVQKHDDNLAQLQGKRKVV
jgi:hypothetical protein